MGWKEPDKTPKPFDPALYKDEGHCESWYKNSQDRWIKDFAPWYELIGVYEIDKDKYLYRFERLEKLRHELHMYAPRFYNVTIMTEKKDEGVVE